MVPFFFGSRQRRLFGIYEPAAGRGGGARAALLCNSWGKEYFNGHRAMRLLAKRLCATGFDTLRFDYFGAGDSGGEASEADLDGWRHDIVSAARELKHMSAAPRVVLVGLRLGATLVAETAPRLHEDIDGVILWDPIVRGLDYVEELAEQGGQKARLSEFKSDMADDMELEGLSVSPAFVSGLKAIDLCSEKLGLQARRLTIFTCKPPSDCQLLNSEGRTSEVLVLKTASPWKDATERTETLPIEVYERIVEWLR
ncbi:pimeloyl-ACP methyl ester carboxylesterase [Bradyrhizobium sp. AZCC 2262]|uniref:serine aminopeptidase domain-containing protein n=1 Tax=Bradyrhizobium sp. AZCC 2262 TaxID=3117022 RepID=UPI002FF1AAAA